MSLPVPTEEIEQRLFVQWLDRHGFKYTAIPNSTYTKSWSQKRKNTAMGLRAGFPDMVVIARNHFICVEMKRRKGSVTSQDQKDWLAALTDAGVPAAICKGADEAQAFIRSVISPAASGV